MSQPPSTAVTSSTRWPGSIRCASQRLRGIMSSSTTTALPRVVPANDSSSSVIEQPEPIEYGSPLSKIWSPCSVISLPSYGNRSEEHTSELQSRGQLACRLLLAQKNTVQH